MAGGLSAGMSMGNCLEKIRGLRNVQGNFLENVWVNVWWEVFWEEMSGGLSGVHPEENVWIPFNTQTLDTDNGPYSDVYHLGHSKNH